MWGKGLGVIALLCAVVALAAMPVSAFAANFHSEAAPAELRGSTLAKTVLESTSTGNSITCVKPVLMANMATTALNELQTKYQFVNCTAYTGVAAEIVSPAACSFDWGPGKGAEGYSGRLECKAGSPMEIKIGGACTAKLVGQSATGGTKVTNEGTGKTRHYHANLQLGGLHYSTSGLLCGLFFGNGEDERIAGSFDMTGFQSGSQVGVWAE